jgi:hypothetical protein
MTVTPATSDAIANTVDCGQLATAGDRRYCLGGKPGFNVKTTLALRIIV